MKKFVTVVDTVTESRPGSPGTRVVVTLVVADTPKPLSCAYWVATVMAPATLSGR